MRLGLRAVIAAGWLLLLVPGPPLHAEQSAGNAAMAWTGTITVERRASGSLRPDNGGPGIDYTGQQTVTFAVNGDGTASWQGTFASRLEMGGLYVLPTRGSGSGHGTSRVAFNGQSWDIAVESAADLPTVTDHTEEDKAWLEKSFLAGLKAMAEAMGQRVPAAGPRLEKGAVGVPGASVPARGAATATALSGSVSETVPGGADQMGGPGTIPATVTVSWNLTKGPVRPHVRIYGEACGCLDPDATEKTLHFIAGASPAGGEFSEFVVTSTGQAPEILSNSGGEQPSLEIAGTKDTGTITLTIRYRRNGVTQESAPFTVEFCAIEKVELEDGNHRDIGFDLDGTLVVQARSRAWRAGQDISPQLEWDIEKMGEPTTLSAEPADQRGSRIKFTYQTMPRRNADFGEKKLTVKTSGSCVCQQDETIRTFYPDVDSNHPDDATPNWFYYWKQTAAVPAGARGLLEFQQSVSDVNVSGTAIARYDQRTQKILIGNAAFSRGACRNEVDDSRVPTGRHAEGIDCFGETVRHELQHRADAVAWWGSAAGPYSVNLLEWFLTDWDHDQVPNTVEEGLAECRPGAWTTPPIDLARLLTMPDDLVERGKKTWFTCRQRPFDDVTDAEINAYREGWKWPLGTANREDWSCGELAKQWTGKKCG